MNLTSDLPVTSKSTSPPEGFRVWQLGSVPYRDAQALQTKLISLRRDWSYDLLILLEHPPVITLGRAKSQDHLRWNPEHLSALGIDYVPSERGGDITLHNPGQLVGYPIVDLKHYRNDLHRFLRQLEEVIMATLSEFNLKAEALPGKTGVWVRGKKIASIGIAVRKWVSYHGFALNIQNDLSLFDAIVPCGLSGVQMTSMQQEFSAPVAMPTVVETLIRQYSHIMNRPLLGAFDDTQISSQT